MDTKKQFKVNNIFKNSSLSLLKETSNYLITHDEMAKSFELYKMLNEVIRDNFTEFKDRENVFSFYQNLILKLEFVALPLLDDKEVFVLIRKNFCLQLDLENYDLVKKIEARLLSLFVIGSRNEFKESLKKEIMINSEIITPNSDIRLVKDWLRNYVSRVGLDKLDKLLKAQYLIDLQNNKQLSSKDRNHLLKLFKFYDYLNIPSDSPQGFEEEPPVVIDGKLYIFRKGTLEAVPDLYENSQTKELLDSIKGGGSNHSQSDKHLKKNSEIVNLQDQLKRYSSASLEYKAISQEINRLKVAEFKKAQRENYVQK